MNILFGLKAFFKSTLITKISSLISQVVLGLYLSQEDFGIYGIVISLTIFTNCFGTGIIQKVLVQKGEGFKLHSNYSPIAFLFGLASFLLLIFIGLIFSSVQANKSTFLLLTFILAISSLLQSLVPVQKASLLAISNYKSVAGMEAFINGFVNILTIPLCLIGAGPYSFIAHKPLLHLYEYIKYNNILSNLKRPMIKLPTLNEVRAVSLIKVFKEFKWLFIGSIFAALIIKGDYLVLGLMVDIKIIGIYFFAYQLSFSLANLFTASVLWNVLLPEFSNKESLSSKNIFLSRCLIALLIIFSPLFFLLSYFSEEVIRFIWNSKWEESIVVVKLLLFIMPLRFFPALLRVYLESQGKWKSSTYLTGISAVGVLIAAFVGGITNSVIGIALSMTFWFSCLGVGSMAYCVRSIGSKNFGIKLFVIGLNLYATFTCAYIFCSNNIIILFLVVVISLLLNLWIARKELNYITDELFGKSYFTLWVDKMKSLYRFMIFHKRVPNLLYPKRITDLILKKRLMWNPKSQIEILTADKLNLRGYVKNHLGNGYLPKLYGVIQKGCGLNFDSFGACVLKSNHGKSCSILSDSFNEENYGKGIDWKNGFIWYRHIQFICEEFLSLKKNFL